MKEIRGFLFSSVFPHSHRVKPMGKEACKGEIQRSDLYVSASRIENPTVRSFWSSFLSRRAHAKAGERERERRERRRDVHDRSQFATSEIRSSQ